MNTPSHLILNLTILGNKDSSKYLLPVFIGALLPDIPMFIFYFVESFIFDTPNQVIWSEAYFEEGWQSFIDCFNSIPITALVLAVAWKFNKQFLVYMCLSMFLHILFDLPVHHDDGHRHFYPLLDWRFESPISYWDPGHHGRLVSLAESAMVVVCCGFMLFRHKQKWCKAIVSALLLLQAANLALSIKFYL